MDEKARYDAEGEEILSVSEAASRLGVSQSTVWRWIAREQVAAYRVGPRRVMLRAADLAMVVRPVGAGTGGGRVMGEHSSAGEGEMTVLQRRRALDALEEARRVRLELVQARGGERFDDSVELIREMRAERERDLP